MLIVKKFGGSSVADRESIFRVAGRCIEEYNRGNDVIVVLSAMGKTTDELIAKAKSFSGSPSRRELDMLMVTGEQISVSLLAIAINSLGVPAVSLNAFQVPVHCTSNYGSARVKRVEKERISHELECKRIVAVAGFQGINKYDDYVTLGRGGSDTSAVALAAVMHADACEIYTDVDGVYTADPRIVHNARKLKQISYDEMLELASLGARILHDRSVEMAKKYGVQLVVRSSLNNEPGTVVKEVGKLEKMLISGVASDTNASRISVLGVADRPGIAFRLFDTLAKKGIDVDIILQSAGHDGGTKDISFTVKQDNVDEAIQALEENKEVLTIQGIEHEDNVAKLSIVGAGMMSNPGVASKMFEALFNAGVNISMISTSEIRITVLIDEKDVDRAMISVHDIFGLAE